MPAFSLPLRGRYLLLSATAAVALAGCGGGSGGSTASAPGGSGSSAATGSKSVTVDIKNFAFMPMEVTVSPGTKITWVNQDSTTHTVTANDKSFDSGDLSQGQKFTYTPSKAGDISYICSIHQYMKGTVHVR